jgi:hypothetical protein
MTVVRLKRYGRQRLVIAHEQADLNDPPRFLPANLYFRKLVCVSWQAMLEFHLSDPVPDS